MLDQSLQARQTPPSSRQRFLKSVAGVLGELKKLLLSSPAPIEPDTGAQIAQMLRVIREGASAHALDAIAHTTGDIEMYLLSAEPYGPSGALRNFIVGSKVEELMAGVADAAGTRTTPIH